MIQLKSAIEEMNKIVVSRSDGRPAWTASEAVRGVMDGRARQELLDWGTSPGRKALLVGASWPRLAADLAERDMFVTVVDPDPHQLRAVSDDAGARGLLSRVTAAPIDARERNYENAGFNLIVCWESLERYVPREPMLKKFVRELKTGGLLYVRAHTAAPSGGTAEATMRRLLPIALSAMAPAASPTIARDSFLGARDQGVDVDALTAEIDKLFIIDRQTREHAGVFDLADLAASVAPWLLPVLERALGNVEPSLRERHPELSRTITVMAKKERELGGTFRVG